MNKSAKPSAFLWLDTKIKTFYWRLENLQPVVCASLSGDHGNAEVADIGTWTVLWVLWIQKKHLLLFLSQLMNQTVHKHTF